MSMTDQNSQQLRKKAALVQRGGARAAVLGVNDGLVSTVCLIIGFAATGADPSLVLTAGFAGLLAGAISMAAGEWISVKSQVELFEGILSDVKHVMRHQKSTLIQSLARALTERGMETRTAHKAAEDIAGSDEKFMDMYVTQVVGMNKDELGSPWRAAIVSFLLFALGSLVPLLPWLFISGYLAMAVSVAMTSIAGLCVGAIVARSSGKPIILGSFRQFLIIVFASAVTFAVGWLFGVNVA